MRKVDKTIALPIYYSLYHDKNLTVKTLFYAQLLNEIISLQKFAMSNINKECQFTYSYPVFLLFFFISARVLSASYSFVCPNTRHVYRQ